MKVLCTERLFDQKTYYEDTIYDLTKEEAERLIKNDQGKRFQKEDGTLLAQPVKKKEVETADTATVSEEAAEKILVLDEIGVKKSELKVLKETETELKKTVELEKKAVKDKKTPADAVEGLNKEIAEQETELERVKEHSKTVTSEIKELFEKLDQLIE